MGCGWRLLYPGGQKGARAQAKGHACAKALGPRGCACGHRACTLGSRVEVRGGVIGLGLQHPSGWRSQVHSRRSGGSGETSMEALPWPQARDRWQARLCWQCGGAERWGRVWRWRQIGWRHALGPSVLGRWLQQPPCGGRQSAEAFLRVLGSCRRGAAWGPLSVGSASRGQSTESGGCVGLRPRQFSKWGSQTSSIGTPWELLEVQILRGTRPESC